MKGRILDKSNKSIVLAKPIACPLGSNAKAIEFGEPTVRCNPTLSAGNAGAHLCKMNYVFN